MSHQHHHRQHPSQATNRTHAAYTDPWPHSTSGHSVPAATYSYEQGASMAGLPIPAFNPYPHHIPAAAMPTMLAPASYHMAPMSTPTDVTQKVYLHANTYNSNTRYHDPQSIHAVIEAVPPFYPNTASDPATSIRSALAYPTGAGSTDIHHSTAYQQTARNSQHRGISPMRLYSPSTPDSPCSSASSYYQPAPPSQPVSGYPSSPSSGSVYLPPPDHVSRVPCLWEGCNILLDDISTAGIKRHIRDWHSELSNAPQKDRKTCLWNDGTVCGRELDAASFAKHIASVHLKSTAQQCEYCHNTIGRADSLARHKRDHCPDRPRR